MKMLRKCFKLAKTAQGYTLMELMVVAAIISLVGASGMWFILDGVPERKVRDESRKLYAGFRQASSLAINRSENIRIVFDLANDAYQITDTGAPATVLASYTFPSDIDVYSATVTTFTFNSRGMGLSGRVKIQYGPDNNAAIRKGIRVTTAGGISLIDERDDNW